MFRYLHTKLFSGPGLSVVITGTHIQVLDTRTGAVLRSTANFTADDHDAVVKSGPICCTAISHGRTYIATCGDDKHLKVWDLASLALLNSRELPKKPTAVEFTTNDDILVADKFGDVFRYSLLPKPEDTSEEPKNDALASHENPSGGDLVLGHASLLTCCLLTPDEDFIITSDRDEHIRVSWYPEGYVIEAYCLGHEKYVSAIHIPSFARGILISGGGDPVLKVWDWMTGRLQRDICIFEAIEPFVTVKAPKPRRKSQEDGDDGGDAEDSKGKGRRKKKGKAKQDTPSNDTEGPSKAPETETVVVVHRISSFVSDRGNHIVFSIVGATALFAFTLADGNDPSPICHFDCGCPVIDFTVAEDGLIWILLDADYAAKTGAESGDKLVRAVKWLTDKFVEADNLPLLESLNTTCTIPATLEDLKTLDLYADLTSLPKHIGEESGSQARDQSELPEGLDGASGEGTSVVDEKGLPKRTAGRLKHKLALQRLQQEKGSRADSEAPDVKRPRAETEEQADVLDTAMDET
ncbi:hypothetical protein SCLCIDRAFT_139079 [Scleroderma citrinum Foug A]|uniref:Uncharacterized protein n=1 Tax=Scleroderma citrinum Foug A TaxID=1036808 RepID=A0A0C2YUS6_9AGAM|nr:hypothetical protein SCLCIDRAFT_139079 [Scleroderma citrinum Foug A]